MQPHTGTLGLMMYQSSSFILLSLQCWHFFLHLFFSCLFWFCLYRCATLPNDLLEKTYPGTNTKRGTFVKLKIHPKEPTVLSAIRVEGDLEVRKPQTQQARLQPIYTSVRGQYWCTRELNLFPSVASTHCIFPSRSSVGLAVNSTICISHRFCLPLWKVKN